MFTASHNIETKCNVFTIKENFHILSDITNILISGKKKVKTLLKLNNHKLNLLSPTRFKTRFKLSPCITTEIGYFDIVDFW